MSKLLLDATLSVAIPTFIPASSIAFTFAIPEPSFKLLFGLCATRTSCSAKNARSSSFNTTPCAITVGRLNNPQLAAYSTGRFPYCASISRTSRSVSER
ncbi:Uncharacterised protein [Streptococcus pneumoniae]|nr:Uncharacterised protein [Streptococcus pneumoniae]